MLRGARQLAQRGRMVGRSAGRSVDSPNAVKRDREPEGRLTAKLLKFSVHVSSVLLQLSR